LVFLVWVFIGVFLCLSLFVCLLVAAWFGFLRCWFLLWLSVIPVCWVGAAFVVWFFLAFVFFFSFLGVVFSCLVPPFLLCRAGFFFCFPLWAFFFSGLPSVFVCFSCNLVLCVPGCFVFVLVCCLVLCFLCLGVGCVCCFLLFCDLVFFSGFAWFLRVCSWLHLCSLFCLCCHRLVLVVTVLGSSVCFGFFLFGWFVVCSVLFCWFRAAFCSSVVVVFFRVVLFFRFCCSGCWLVIGGFWCGVGLWSLFRVVVGRLVGLPFFVSVAFFFLVRCLWCCAFLLLLMGAVGWLAFRGGGFGVCFLCGCVCVVLGSVFSWAFSSGVFLWVFLPFFVFLGFLRRRIGGDPPFLRLLFAVFIFGTCGSWVISFSLVLCLVPLFFCSLVGFFLASLPCLAIRLGYCCRPVHDWHFVLPFLISLFSMGVFILFLPSVPWAAFCAGDSPACVPCVASALLALVGCLLLHLSLALISEFGSPACCCGFC